MANILIRGKVAEALDDIEAACWQYENALRVAEFLSQPAETGEIHHGIGSCASRLGNPGRAYQAYLAAARMFAVYGAPQGFPFRLSDALGEAGMLLAVFELNISHVESADEKLLDQGLDDAMRNANAILFGALPPTRAGVAALHRKLTGLLVLAASATNSAFFLGARRVMDKSISARFCDRYGMSATSFAALSRLYAMIGEQEKPERKVAPTTKSAFKNMVNDVCDPFDYMDCVMMRKWFSRALSALIDSGK